MAVFWALILPFLLVAAPFIFLMISDLDQFVALIFLISIFTLGIICRWQVALLMMACGIYGSIVLEEFTNPYLKPTGIMDIISQFKIIYAALLTGGVIIAFLKPKQEAAERSEEMVEHLNHTLEDQNARILELSTLKQTFLRNLQHETNTPITGVYSMSQALHDCYDKLSDKERKAAINTIVTSAERLISYANNLIDVSKLSSSGYNLNMRKINLSNLLEEALRKVRRLYITAATEEDREVEMSIEPNISILCDEYYIRKSFENMLINAIQYCKKGKITISLSKSKAGTTEEAVEFSIRDSGIGIPKEELVTIFDPFTTSSKTTTPAGGRGMGLTLAKAVAQAHKGTIAADSDGKTYSLFTMRLSTESIR